MALVIRLKPGVRLDGTTNVGWATLNNMFDLGYAVIESGQVENAQIADATITLAKLAGLTAGYVIVGDGSNRPAAALMQGDASIAADGTVTVANHLKDTTQWQGDAVKFPVKAAPDSADVLLLEDSAASYAKKSTTVAELLATFSSFPRYHKHNLVVANNAITPTTLIDITADELVVSDHATQTTHRRIAGVSASANLTLAAAPGGRETGLGATTNTRYYVHVIYNPGTDAHSAVLSASPTAPNLGSPEFDGWTYRRCVGEAITGGTVALVEQRRQDDQVWFQNIEWVFNNATLNAAMTQYSLRVYGAECVVPAAAIELDMEASTTQTGVAPTLTYPPAIAIVGPTSSSTRAVVQYSSHITANYTTTFLGPYGNPVRFRMLKTAGATSIWAAYGYASWAGNQNLGVWGYRLPR